MSSSATHLPTPPLILRFKSKCSQGGTFFRLTSIACLAIMLRRTLMVLVTGLVDLSLAGDTNRLVGIRKAVDRMKHHRGEKIDI